MIHKVTEILTDMYIVSNLTCFMRFDKDIIVLKFVRIQHKKSYNLQVIDITI